MSYLPTGDAIFTPEQRAALEVSPAELRSLDRETKLDYLMRYHEVKTQKASTFWDALASSLPLLAFLGIDRLLGGKKR